MGVNTWERLGKDRLTFAASTSIHILLSSGHFVFANELYCKNKNKTKKLEKGGDFIQCHNMCFFCAVLEKEYACNSSLSIYISYFKQVKFEYMCIYVCKHLCFGNFKICFDWQLLAWGNIAKTNLTWNRLIFFLKNSASLQVTHTVEMCRQGFERSAELQTPLPLPLVPTFAFYQGMTATSGVADLKR